MTIGASSPVKFKAKWKPSRINILLAFAPKRSRVGKVLDGKITKSLGDVL